MQDFCILLLNNESSTAGAVDHVFDDLKLRQQHRKAFCLEPSHPCSQTHQASKINLQM